MSLLRDVTLPVLRRPVSQGKHKYISTITTTIVNIPIPLEDVEMLAALGNCSCVALPPASMPSSLPPITYHL